jgi:adenylate kinase family enzyme
MKKIAVFGGPGVGKSTLAKKMAVITQLPLHALDKLCYEAGGVAVPAEVYAKRHVEILAQPGWLMEGYGSYETLWARLNEADTLVYLDLPLSTQFWWISKRFFTGLLSTPEGWPPRSPMLSSTLASYRHVWLCHKHLTPKYRAFVAQAPASKQVFHLRSPADIAAFLCQLPTR